MERIDKVLANFPRLAPDQRTPRDPVEELQEDRAELLRRDLNVSSMANTFEALVEVPGMKSCIKAFKDFASGAGKPFLLCYGGTGNGKTHLMEAAVISIYKSGRFARIIRFPEVLSALKRSMDKGAIPPYEVIMRNFRVGKMLLLDDVGMGHVDSQWANSVLEDIVCYRYSERLPTVITTNKDITDLPERVISRFKDRSVAVMCLNESPDYRPRKR